MFYASPKSKPTTKFGEWLDEQMRINNMSTRDVGNKLHCSSLTVSNHRSAKKHPTFSDVVTYCWLFGCSDDPETVWKMTDISIEEGDYGLR